MFFFFKSSLENQPNMYLLICNDSWVIWCVHLQAPQMLIWLALCLNEVILKVLYTICVPILTSAVREISAGDMCCCHAAMNDAIWKIFSYAVWDSIRHLQLSRGYTCVYKLFASAKTKFLAFLLDLSLNKTRQYLISSCAEPYQNIPLNHLL